MKRWIVKISTIIVLLAGLTFPTAASALAASNPNGTGQPSQSCGSSTAGSTPGDASSAPGSAFNPGGTAGGVYAGQQPQNSNNSHSVAQYDVACYQVSQHH